MNSIKIRMRWLWTMLLAPPLFLGVLIILYLIIKQLDPSNPETETLLRLALPYILVVSHLSLFAILLFILNRSGIRLRDIGWNLDQTSILNEIVIALVAAIGFYLFKEFAIDSVLAVINGNKPTFTSLFNFRWEDIYLPMALAATGLVFVEESIYRGFAIPSLMQKYGTVTSVVISSVMFGFLHWGNGLFAIASTAVLGAGFACLFLWRENLVAVTLAHAGYNILVLAT